MITGQLTETVVVPRAVVTVRLFLSQDGEPAGLVDVVGDLTEDQALIQAFFAIYKYLERHISDKSPRRDS